MNIGSYVQELHVAKRDAITAWRGWRKNQSPYRLVSVCRGGSWNRTKRADHLPDSANNSGLWALKSYWDPDTSKECLLRNPYRGEIQGRVELWGTIVEHKYGYRAEHAEITGIVVPKAGHIADWYAHIFGVERLKMKPVAQVVTYDVDTWPSFKPK